ncbi:hypothetical protein HZA57_02225 [Candidatus Poribacteria bacterium]|nr:hypothetical protein [Candidatus Poribacteria bacterium]
MQANSDFKELLSALNGEGAEYLIVGAHAVILYAEPRFTKDLDIWVGSSPENAQRVWRALKAFGAPLAGMCATDFTQADMVYQMGVPPNRIDVVMGIDGVSFDEAWPNRVTTSYDGLPTPVISKPDLIRAKRASGRPQDLLDLQRLLDSEEHGD